LNPDEGISRARQTPSEENSYKDGVLTMGRKRTIIFPSIRATDMSIRAQVQIPRGNRVQLMLRASDDANYIAGFTRQADGNGYFGFIKTEQGNWRNLKGDGNQDTTYGDDEFVEFRFTVVGNLLTIHANGRKMLELWDATHEGKAGSPGIQVNESGCRVKDIEVKLLKE
jgi:hypothetical protein